VVLCQAYSTGRLLKSAFYAEFKIEISDRTLAEMGPTADLLFTIGDGNIPEAAIKKGTHLSS